MRGVLVALGLVLAPIALSAPPTPARIVQYRRAVMEASDGHLVALGMIVKGESDRTADRLMHATALHDLATTLPTLFPEGTAAGNDTFESDARPDIWTDKEKFAALVTTFEAETNKLVEAAKKNDTKGIKTAFAATSAACGECHESFKIDEEHHD